MLFRLPHGPLAAFGCRISAAARGLFAALGLLLMLAAPALAQDAATATADGGNGLSGLLTATIALVVVLFVLIVVVIARVMRLVDFRPLDKFKANEVQSALLIVFFLAGLALLVYEHVTFSEYLTLASNAASEHGVEIDTMLAITVVITGIVFLVTHALLFFFPFIYRGRPGNTASYYHDNNRLEAFWTMVPAVVLAILVLVGVRTWNHYNYPEHTEEPLLVHFTAEQFQWRMRYPGQDGQLGTYNYKNVANNPYGLDSAEAIAQDDLLIKGKAIKLPVNRPVQVRINAKDVLHGFYAPHFRAQIYAVPGMPTQVSFKPIVTTAEMRRRTGVDTFNFEIACSQLCGSSHYNMRVELEIVEEAEYEAWLAEQGTFLAQVDDATAGEAAKAQPEAGQEPGQDRNTTDEAAVEEEAADGEPMAQARF